MTSTPMPTGISGLDESLRGGLPRANLYMLRGSPGSGKSTAVLQFLLAGVGCGRTLHGCRLSQTRAELAMIAASYGWSLAGLRVEELTAANESMSPSDPSIFQAAELRLDETRSAIERAVEEHQPHRLVYDSRLEIKLLTGDTPRFRRDLVDFK